MQRWAIGLEYLGTAGEGWQSQTGGRGIADRFVAAAGAIQGCETDAMKLPVASGRTDSGVHACNQVIHLNLPPGRSERAWVLGLNTELPHDIRARWARPVNDDFHARFSACRRNYLYLLCNSPVLSAFKRSRMAWERRPLDEGAMQAAADSLPGERDFAAFRSARCSARTSTRNLHCLKIRRSGDIIAFEITANAFLHNMCRVLVGSLWKVGLGQWPVEKMAQILHSKDRSQAGQTAPAEGLYFLGPEYPAEYDLPPPPSAEQVMLKAGC